MTRDELPFGHGVFGVARVRLVPIDGDTSAETHARMQRIESQLDEIIAQLKAEHDSARTAPDPTPDLDTDSSVRAFTFEAEVLDELKVDLAKLADARREKATRDADPTQLKNKARRAIRAALLHAPKGAGMAAGMKVFYWVVEIVKAAVST